LTLINIYGKELCMNFLNFKVIFVLILAIIFLNNCNESKKSPTESNLPEVDQVVVVGTQVAENFLNTGMFALSAIPLDNQGAAILSNQVTAQVAINEPFGVTANVNIDQVVNPSGKPLAIALNIDGSGSMDWNDPNGLRKSGAKFFVDVLEASGYPYEAAVFEFPGFSNYNFINCQLHQDFINNPDTLKNAINWIGDSGGTPTYESLIEILNYVDTTRALTNYDRAIVLLSDGEPNSTYLQDSTCSLANSLEIPIFTIGLGPASDLDSLNMSVTAVENMRYIANCTGGVYAGISPVDTSSASAIYGSMANATSQGSIIFNVQLSGTGFNGLSSGDLISGIITILSSGANAVASFSFVVP
ncbi:VWA domain-containing protein, partial [Calditrichota bacterium]